MIFFFALSCFESLATLRIAEVIANTVYTLLWAELKDYVRAQNYIYFRLIFSIRISYLLILFS